METEPNTNRPPSRADDARPRERFVQVPVGAGADAVAKLIAVGAPDPAGSYAVLVQLVLHAEWREPGRGTLRANKSDLAELFGVSRWRIGHLLEPLETAALVRCE